MSVTPHVPDRSWVDRRGHAADRAPVRLASPGPERCDRCGESPPRLFFLADSGELICGECRCLEGFSGDARQAG